eukprot:gene435-10106_t
MPDNRGELFMQAGAAVGAGITAFCFVTIVLNLFVCYKIYRRRASRASSTAIIVANLACVDILVTLKDLPMLFNVSKTGRWYFEENWCSAYGLTNVIFIIVSVSSLVTITTERYVRIRDMALPAEQKYRSRPLLLGYVIAHTTLSYSLSLLWSKYIFLARKAYCRVEWPPRQGFSFTFITSFIFIIPVSFLIYNLLYRSVFNKENGENEEGDKLKDDSSDDNENIAHRQLQVAVGLFLVSWLPYVIESMVSGYIELPPVASIFTACLPMMSTSLLPFIYLRFLKDDDTRNHTQLLSVYVQ